MSVGKMTGPKKAAILLLALGEEGASEIDDYEKGINKAGMPKEALTKVQSEINKLKLSQLRGHVQPTIRSKKYKKISCYVSP